MYDPSYCESDDVIPCTQLRDPSLAGNGGSLEKCRRRWDLADNPQLQYKYMQSFDRAMNHLDKAFGFIGAPHTCAPEP